MIFYLIVLCVGCYWIGVFSEKRIASKRKKPVIQHVASNKIEFTSQDLKKLKSYFKPEYSFQRIKKISAGFKYCTFVDCDAQGCVIENLDYVFERVYDWKRVVEEFPTLLTELGITPNNSIPKVVLDESEYEDLKYKASLVDSAEHELEQACKC